MDLMRLLRSLEEFLYELVGWLVFYPRTFWRILSRPGAIARYTRIELAQDSERQFGETMSPVLMLILTVAIGHAIEMAARLSLPPADSPLRVLVFGSEQALLLMRSAVYSTYALGAALGTLRRQRQPITRDTLREPFSIQAFLVCPFVLLTSAGGAMARMSEGVAATVGLVIAAAGCAWYIAARTAAYRALYGGGWARPLASVLGWFLATTAFVLALGWVVMA